MNCELPDVCANNDGQPPVRQTNSDSTLCERVMERDQPLLRAILVLVLCMNFAAGRYILYPFTIFSTWIHEMCHGMAAILVGGRVVQLKVYGDGSGLAYTWTPGQNNMKRAIVASAGYTGTALIGGILLLFRRTTLGPTIGIIGMGIMILISCALIVRNTFGLVALSIMGVVLIICGWKLKAQHVGHLYAFLAATCSFNAVNSIKELFAPGQGYVGGEPRYSDAHSVSEYIGRPYWFWALCWFVFALVMSIIGIIFVFEPRSMPACCLTQPQQEQPADWTVIGSTQQQHQQHLFGSTQQQPQQQPQQQAANWSIFGSKQQQQQQAADWLCPHCTLLNSASDTHCKSCGYQK